MLYSLTRVHCPGEGEFLFILRAGSLTKEEVPEPPETLIIASGSPAVQTSLLYVAAINAFLCSYVPRPHTPCSGRYGNGNYC